MISILMVGLLLLTFVFWSGLMAEQRETRIRMNTICDTDDRLPDQDYPVGRLYFNEREEAICTAWIAPNGWLVTAGHCASGYYRFDEVQFQVPASICKGEIQLPAVSDRFQILQESLKLKVDLPTTQDWAIFRIKPNAQGMPSYFIEGKFFRLSNHRIDAKESKSLKNTGFGVELRTFDGCKKRNRTMQSSVATAHNSPGYLIHYADTHMGSSGSPLYEESSGSLYAYGTHRGGGCPNIATSVLNPGFLKALNNANGSPTIYLDSIGPMQQPSTGGIEAPFKSMQDALDNVEHGGEINVVPGHYSMKELQIPNRPLRIRAPFGSISIQETE